MSRLNKAQQEQAFQHLETISLAFENRIGDTFTDKDNECVQGLIERMKLQTIAFAECSPAALNNMTKKYNRAKKEQGGLKYERVIPD
jgi:hypothetical protein